MPDARKCLKCRKPMPWQASWKLAERLPDRVTFDGVTPDGTRVYTREGRQRVFDSGPGWFCADCGFLLTEVALAEFQEIGEQLDRLARIPGGVQ